MTPVSVPTPRPAPAARCAGAPASGGPGRWPGGRTGDGRVDSADLRAVVDDAVVGNVCRQLEVPTEREDVLHTARDPAEG